MRASCWAWCGCLALGMLALPAEAAEKRFELDARASEVRFTLGATLDRVEGSFRFAEGQLTFDPATGATKGRWIVDAKSGDTGNKKRDRDMHDKVLESARYPEISFDVQKVVGDLLPPGGKIDIEGILELHGARHPMKIAAELEIESSRATASGRFTVPYVEWGLKDPSLFLLRVEKRVEVAFKVVGSIAD